MCIQQRYSLGLTTYSRSFEVGSDTSGNFDNEHNSQKYGKLDLEIKFNFKVHYVEKRGSNSSYNNHDP